VLVEPLFARFAPMQDGPLRDRLMALASQAGVAVRDVLVADASQRTNALNAYVSGLGPTRRVVVHDTLLQRGDDEVAAVVAHELGHVLGLVHREVPDSTPKHFRPGMMFPSMKSAHTVWRFSEDECLLARRTAQERWHEALR
jgi:hypothetical protein